MTIKFQFHKGTIRTRQSWLSGRPWQNFNSIKVRLEPSRSFSICSRSVYFNSIKVRLERSALSDSYIKCINFNSIKVRLEPSLSSSASLQKSNFNSIKVRLEHSERVQGVCRQEFQFHKGTIRTYNELTQLVLDT